MTKKQRGVLVAIAEKTDFANIVVKAQDAKKFIQGLHQIAVSVYEKNKGEYGYLKSGLLAHAAAIDAVMSTPDDQIPEEFLTITDL